MRSSAGVAECMKGQLLAVYVRVCLYFFLFCTIDKGHATKNVGVMLGCCMEGCAAWRDVQW